MTFGGGLSLDMTDSLSHLSSITSSFLPRVRALRDFPVGLSTGITNEQVTYFFSPLEEFKPKLLISEQNVGILDYCPKQISR